MAIDNYSERFFDTIVCILQDKCGMEEMKNDSLQFGLRVDFKLLFFFIKSIFSIIICRDDRLNLRNVLYVIRYVCVCHMFHVEFHFHLLLKNVINNNGIYFLFI